jgi:ABC-type uncharacterized transport system substrate-binding protein
LIPDVVLGAGKAMRRREFIKLLSNTVVAWPLTARAQRPAMPVIGFLSSVSPQPFANYVAGFRAGLKEGGYIDGQNVTIEFRWAEGHYDRLPEMAADLVRHKVAVLVSTGGEPSVLAAKAATTTIPIVFPSGVDPIRAGIVSRLSRPRISCLCPLMALSGHAHDPQRCPLLGVKRTSIRGASVVTALVWYRRN